MKAAAAWSSRALTFGAGAGPVGAAGAPGAAGGPVGTCSKVGGAAPKMASSASFREFRMTALSP